MNLLDVLRPECIEVGLELTGKAIVFEAMASAAARHSSLARLEKSALVEGLREREALGSTAFGGGIAIPHCRLQEAREFVVGILTAPGGVEFDAMDGKPVKVFVFIVAPARETNEHIRVLSAISQALSTPGAVDELAAAKTAEAACRSFARYVHDEVDTKGHGNKHMLHVFLQEEDLFPQILQVLTGVEASSVAVVETKNAREFLTKLPLFAGVLTNGHLGFSRAVIAVIEKSMTNETIRRIQHVAGRLDDRSGVMVAVQEVFYVSGMLDA